MSTPGMQTTLALYADLERRIRKDADLSGGSVASDGTLRATSPKSQRLRSALQAKADAHNTGGRISQSDAQVLREAAQSVQNFLKDE